MITITMLTCNRREYLKLTLASLRQHLQDTEPDIGAQVVCCDTGSSVDDRRELQSMGFDLLLLSENNPGLGPAMNRLVSTVRTPYILHLQDDWFIANDLKVPFLREAIRILEFDRNIAHVKLDSCPGLNVGNRQVYAGPFRSPAGAVSYVVQNPGQCGGGFALHPALTRTAALHELGPFREDQPFRAGWAESDYAQRFAHSFHAAISPELLLFRRIDDEPAPGGNGTLIGPAADGLQVMTPSRQPLTGIPPTEPTPATHAGSARGISRAHRASPRSACIHFVYAGDPKDDGVIHAPQTITNRVFRSLERRMPVRTYDVRDMTTEVDVQSDDLILGHPMQQPGTMLGRLWAKPCAGRFLMWPFHSAIPSITRFVKTFAAHADKLLMISGPYWTDTIVFTEFAEWQPKIVRLDNSIDPSYLPLRKHHVNPPGNRGLFVMGRSGPEKGTSELFDWLNTITDRVVIAGHYVEEDIERIKNRPNTVILGRISLKDPEVVRLITTQCDFFLNHSVSDASPTTLLEGMAMGLVPITTPQCGYVYPSFFLTRLQDPVGNREVLSRAQGIADTEFLERQADGYEKIRQYHTWDRFCATIWETLEPYRVRQGISQRTVGAGLP